MVSRLTLGSTLSGADEAGWELEKSLVSMFLYKRSLAELSILFSFYIYLKLYANQPSLLLSLAVCNDTLTNIKKCKIEV
jgi:hypothetical protein